MRRLLYLVLVFLVTPSIAHAQLTTLNDSQGYPWEIDSSYYGFVDDGADDAYDGWPSSCVITDQSKTDVCSTSERYSASGSAPTFDLNSRQIIMGVKSLNGLVVSRKIYVPENSTHGFCRFMEILENPTGSPITIKVRVGSTTSPPWYVTTRESLGSDDETTICATSAGTTTLAAGLQWFTTDDHTDNGGDTGLAHVVAGSGATVQMGYIAQYPYSREVDFIYWEYRNITVPAGDEVIILHFQSQQASRATSQAVAQWLAGLPEEATYGMTTDELSKVVNFKFTLRPVAEANGPYSGNEGTGISMAATGSYARSGSLVKYEWDCTTDGTWDVSTTSTRATCTYGVHGNYTATLRVTDSNGNTATDTGSVTVANLAPAISNVTVDNPGFEGDNVVFSATASDPGPADTLTYLWSFGDGTTGSGAAATHSYSDQGTYTVRVTVTDTANASVSYTTTVTLLNANPTIDSFEVPSTSTEGATVSMSAQASDKGRADVLTYTWRFGDGQSVSDEDLEAVTHTYTQNGTYTVTLTVTDDDGGSVTDTRTLDVSNVAPTIVSVNYTTTGPEGSSFVFEATATDPGADTLTYRWNFGDGSATGSGSTTSHIFLNDGNYTVTLTVSDPNNGVATANLPVAVSNVAPTLDSLTGNMTGNEGATLSFSATGSDAGDDALTYTWSFGDGGTGAGATTSHVYADDGSYMLEVTVTDEDGESDSAIAMVVVANVNPSITKLSGDFSGLEGQTLHFDAAATDPGTDTLTYIWDFGDGSETLSGVDLTSVSHSYTQIDTYTLTLTVNDEDGGKASTTRTVNIGNDAPSISSLDGDVTGNEGDTFEFTATATDPGGDILDYIWSFGDDSEDVTGTGLAQVSHIYRDNGTYDLTLEVRDQGGLSTSAALRITVNNVAPSLVSMTGDETGLTGTPVVFSAEADDPGPDDVLQYTWDFGDGTEDETGSSATHTYLEPGTYTVTVSVTDGDGGSATGQLIIVIDNSGPTVGEIQGPTALTEGQAGTYTVEVTSVTEDIYYAWDFGDGTSSSAHSPTHTFADDGTFTITVVVSDKYGATAERSLQVVVDNAAPVISNATIPTSASQGTLLSFSVTASDAGNDPLRYRWNFGDDATADTAQATHRYPNAGTFEVTITVTDDAGATASRKGTLEISNLPPEIDTFSVDSTGREGGDISASYSAHDASGVEPVATINWGDGKVEPITEGAIAHHAYADNGTYEVTLTVVDADGVTDTAQGTVTISNVAPSITAFNFTAYGAEGETYEFSASATDPAGAADPLTYTYNFGDGSAPASGVNLTSTTHVYVSSGNYTVSVTVTDGDGGSTSRSGTVNVGTAAPVIVKFEGDDSGNEGSEFFFDAQARDPVDQTLTYSWDFGDGSAPVAGENLASTSHTYADDGAYTVTLTVTDPDKLSTSQTLEVRVVNVAPTFVSEPPLLASEGVTYRYQAEATDPAGDADPLIFALVSGPEGMSMTQNGLLTWTPTLAQAGDHAVSIRVNDGDGGSATQQWTVNMSSQDSDTDGMPDSWEAQYGFDPENPEDAALDADADGITNLEEFENGTNPIESNGPGVPTLEAPINGQEVTTLTPELRIGNASDPDDDLLTYEFEVYADASLTQLVTAATVDEAKDTVSTSFVVDIPLADNADAWWRARARDAYIAGSWSSTARFFVNLSNDAPSAPVPNMPADGATIGSPTPNLEVMNAIDIDRDVLTYTFEIYTTGDETTPVASESAVPEGESGATSWQVPIALEEGGEYAWRCQATDSENVNSDWSEWRTFVVSTENGAPSEPTISYPYPNSEVPSTQPEFEVGPATDPEGDALTYVFQVDRTDMPNGEALQESPVLSPDPDGDIRWTPPIPLADNTEHILRVQADDGESTSEWVSLTFFVNTMNDAPLPPTLQNPSDGSQVEEGTITFSLINAMDVDRDPLSYNFVVRLEGADEVWRSEAVVEGAEGITSTSVSSDDLGGQGSYEWSAFATDNDGLAGEPAAFNRFSIGVGGDDDDDNTFPGDDDTTMPGDDDTTIPGDDDATVPGDDDTTMPGDDDTTVPGDDDTTMPGDDDATATGDDDASVPGDDDATTTGDDDSDLSPSPTDGGGDVSEGCNCNHQNRPSSSLAWIFAGALALLLFRRRGVE